MAHFGSHAFVAGRHWGKHRGVDGNAGLAPQDDAQEIQIRHSCHSADADCADGVFAHTLSRLKCFSSVTGNRHRVPTWICKLLLPKFNTWKPVQIERKKGSLQLFDNAVGRFLAKKFCRYGAIVSRLHRNGNAIAP